MADIDGIKGTLDDEPRGELRLESYYGLVVATPLATCSGCNQVVLYETRTGNLVTAECRCLEQGDG